MANAYGGRALKSLKLATVLYLAVGIVVLHDTATTPANAADSSLSRLNIIVPTRPGARTFNLAQCFQRELLLMGIESRVIAAYVPGKRYEKQGRMIFPIDWNATYKKLANKMKPDGQNIGILNSRSFEKTNLDYGLFEPIALISKQKARWTAFIGPRGLNPSAVDKIYQVLSRAIQNFVPGNRPGGSGDVLKRRKNCQKYVSQFFNIRWKDRNYLKVLME